MSLQASLSYSVFQGTSWNLHPADQTRKTVLISAHCRKIANQGFQCCSAFCGIVCTLNKNVNRERVGTLLPSPDCSTAGEANEESLISHDDGSLSL